MSLLVAPLALLWPAAALAALGDGRRRPVGWAAVGVLAVAVGLHDTWARKIPGTVTFEVWVGGAPVASTIVTNRSGWQHLRIDTARRCPAATIPRRTRSR